MDTTLLIGINAKFIHSNLAIRSIASYIQAHIGDKISLQLLEFSINQETDYILSQIMEKKPTLIGFSCYLWNIELVRKLSRSIKKLLPYCQILYGGPEVSYTVESELIHNPSVDYILTGEGEVTFLALLSYLNLNQGFPTHGVAYWDKGQIVQLSSNGGMSLDDLVFPYTLDFSGLDHRILYYETSRGCPFNCQYCLSSIEKGVRFKSLNKVYEELSIFLNNKVRQVKFVDRTFNAKQEHALGIMKYIIAHDNGVTNFHFEVAPELVTEDFLDILKQARQGLFQLEMGVQSTNPLTLQIIKRHNQLDKITYAAQRIKELHNTHIHMDLIAGLPEEGFKRFGQSFDYVYQLQPNQLQLGFLKVLKGSGMMQMTERYRIEYRDYPPYEVLQTHMLSYQELEDLKLIEEMVELFYNSSQYVRFIQLFIQTFESPFDGFYWLSTQWKAQGMHHQKHQKLDLYQFLFDCIGTPNIRSDIRSDISSNEIMVHELIRALTYDYCLREKPKKDLPWMGLQPLDPKLSTFLLEGIEKHGFWIEESQNYTTKQRSRMFHMSKLDVPTSMMKEYFEDSHIAITLSLQEMGFDVSRDEFQNESRNEPQNFYDFYGNYLVINYEHRDFLHNNGEVIFIAVVK